MFILHMYLKSNCPPLPFKKYDKDLIFYLISLPSLRNLYAQMHTCYSVCCGHHCTRLPDYSLWQECCETGGGDCDGYSSLHGNWSVEDTSLWILSWILPNSVFTLTSQSIKTVWIALYSGGWLFIRFVRWLVVRRDSEDTNKHVSDQTRPYRTRTDNTRPDKNRPDQTRPD